MLNKLYLRDRWTIGFIESDIRTIIEERNTSPKIHWLKHNYTDRFWADPFILDVEENGNIRVLVEEMIWTKAKGTIVELLVSPDYKLIDKWELLQEDVHLSYPFIERKEGQVFVYPESSRSGKLIKYQLCNHRLLKLTTELSLPVCDATKIILDNNEWWFGTLYGEGQDRDLYAFYREYGSEDDYTAHPKNPIISDMIHSRPAGTFVESNGRYYRCAQDSSRTYGGGLSISEVDTLDIFSYKEKLLFQILPDAEGECPNGIHTINGYKGLTVVDGIRAVKFAPITKIIFIIKNLTEKYGRTKLAKNNA